MATADKTAETQIAATAASGLPAVIGVTPGDNGGCQLQVRMHESMIRATLRLTAQQADQLREALT